MVVVVVVYDVGETCLLTYLLNSFTPWCRIFSEKLTVTQLVKE